MLQSNTHLNNKILIIEDDLDDQMLLKMALQEAGCLNEIVCFCDGVKALHYLRSDLSNLFLVLCDINMPAMNGFVFKSELNNDADLISRCTPFLFVSTSNSPEVIIKAFSFSPQGYFVKPDDFRELLKMATNIVNYWNNSITPNKVIELVA